MQRRVFLRSEGTSVEVGAPQQLSGPLLATSRDLISRFDKFYGEVAAAYYTHPELRAEFLVNPLIEPLIELEADRPIATPLSRFDVVLGADGSLRVIELNSNGVCLFHLRSLLYLIRELDRGGFPDDAKHLDELAHATVTAFLRYVATRGPVPTRPVIGALGPTHHLRAGHLLFRAAFERHGCDYVFGAPEHLGITDRGVQLRGRTVDVLWADFLFYLAYQCGRYQQTKWPSKMPDFGQAPAQTAALLADRRFIDHVRTGRVVLLSPARSYLALPKSLLSWTHREDRPITDRAFLAAHVARTSSHLDRLEHRIALDDIAAARERYLIKPCQYGGSHGVQLGRMLDDATWRTRLTEIWDDPDWVVQEFYKPARTPSGAWVSLGLQNFLGAFGGAYIRTSSSELISARDAEFIPCVAE